MLAFRLFPDSRISLLLPSPTAKYQLPTTDIKPTSTKYRGPTSRLHQQPAWVKSFSSLPLQASRLSRPASLDRLNFPFLFSFHPMEIKRTIEKKTPTCCTSAPPLLHESTTPHAFYFLFFSSSLFPFADAQTPCSGPPLSGLWCPWYEVFFDFWI